MLKYAAGWQQTATATTAAVVNPTPGHEIMSDVIASDAPPAVRHGRFIPATTGNQHLSFFSGSTYYKALILNIKSRKVI